MCIAASCVSAWTNQEIMTINEFKEHWRQQRHMAELPPHHYRTLRGGSLAGE
jgi:hypothetical protein